MSLANSATKNLFPEEIAQTDRQYSVSISFKRTALFLKLLHESVDSKQDSQVILLVVSIPAMYAVSRGASLYDYFHHAERTN